jgi:sugar O-acyltransferase (sialic acid O-acetyltransferase NeuD family)
MAPAQPLLILGTRTLSVEIADFVAEIPGFEVTGFVENMERERCAEPLEGLPILWVDEIAALAGTHQAICGLATTFRDSYIHQVAALGMRFATVVHPTAHVSSKTTLGEGTIVSPGAVIASHTQVGRHVLINRGVLIGHHTTIGDFATLQPGANVAGACDIGSHVYIGMGGIVIDHLSVGSHSVAGAGAVVTEDVPDHVLVVGVPARIVKQGIAGK